MCIVIAPTSGMNLVIRSFDPTYWLNGDEPVTRSDRMPARLRSTILHRYKKSVLSCRNRAISLNYWSWLGGRFTGILPLWVASWQRCTWWISRRHHSCLYWSHLGSDNFFRTSGSLTPCCDLSLAL